MALGMSSLLPQFPLSFSWRYPSIADRHLWTSSSYCSRGWRGHAGRIFGRQVPLVQGSQGNREYEIIRTRDWTSPYVLTRFEPKIASAEPESLDSHTYTYDSSPSQELQASSISGTPLRKQPRNIPTPSASGPAKAFILFSRLTTLQ